MLHLCFPMLSLQLYLMGSHYVSLPRYFWDPHLCQPLCSLESYTTTLVGFLPTSLVTLLLAPLKVISSEQPCTGYLFLEPRHRKALLTQA